MNRTQQQSVAKNEAFFRGVNEAISRTADPLYAADERITFVCECGRTDCDEPLTLERSEYEAIRKDGSTFAILPDHVIEGAEMVVARHPGYWVVRKVDHAREVAEDTDPRRQ